MEAHKKSNVFSSRLSTQRHSYRVSPLMQSNVHLDVYSTVVNYGVSRNPLNGRSRLEWHRTAVVYIPGKFGCCLPGYYELSHQGNVSCPHPLAVSLVHNNRLLFSSTDASYAAGSFEGSL